MVDSIETEGNENKKKKKRRKVPAEREIKTSLPDNKKIGYTYLEMLSRLFEIKGKDQKDDSDDKLTNEVDPPEVCFQGTKKTVWKNFKATAEKLKRSEEHMSSYFSAEIGTQTSIDSNGQMIIKGRLHQNKLERPLKHYINEYVKCHTCKNFCTHLKRDPNTRLLFLMCNGCGSDRSVVQFRNLYHATNRADRINAKKAAAS